MKHVTMFTEDIGLRAQELSEKSQSCHSSTYSYIFWDGLRFRGFSQGLHRAWDQGLASGGRLHQRRRGFEEYLEVHGTA